MILIPLWDVFKNADKFDDPDSFKPERFTSTDVKSKIISFGLGMFQLEVVTSFQHQAMTAGFTYSIIGQRIYTSFEYSERILSTLRKFV